MSRSTVAFNLAYTSHRGKRGKSGSAELRAKLRYLQYRDDRDGTIPQDEGRERWVDRGLGGHWREVHSNCARYASRNVLAWTLVISPDPKLMALVPEDQRAAVLKAVTEQTVEQYYAVRGVEVPEYSYVTHDRLTNGEQPGDNGQQQLHSHVVLPGTVPLPEGGREVVYNRVRQGHFKQLRNIAAETFESALDRTIGSEWRIAHERTLVHEKSPQISLELE